MSNLLRILLVEDSENDALLLIRHIQRSGYEIKYERVVDAGKMNDALKHQNWDVVIADYSLPSFNCLAALSILKQKDIDIPFIIVSGTIGEELAVQAMKAGAHDYVMKGNLTRLIPAIQRELVEAQVRRENRHAKEALRESENRYCGLFEGSKDAIFFSNVEGKFIDINPAGVGLFGYSSKEEILSAEIKQCFFTDSYTDMKRKEFIKVNGIIKDFEYTIKRKDGSSAIVLETTAPVEDLQGNVIIFRSILREITKKKQLER